MPGNREVVECVAEDQVVFLGVLVQVDELPGIAPVGLDGCVVGQPGRLEVGAGDVGVDLGHVDLGAGVGELHVPLEAIGTAAQEQRLHARCSTAGSTEPFAGVCIDHVALKSSVSKRQLLGNRRHFLSFWSSSPEPARSEARRRLAVSPAFSGVRSAGLLASSPFERGSGRRRFLVARRRHSVASRAAWSGAARAFPARHRQLAAGLGRPISHHG